MIALAAGDWQATLRPAIGGAIATLTCAGTPILRPMPDCAAGPLDAACFPLVPYANRIAKGRFVAAGRDVSLRPNLAGDDHPLHGTGWLAPWRTVRADAASALLEHAEDGCGEWPWAFVAHQHVALDRAGCTIRLLVQNTSAEAAPMGLGLHPYFRRSVETRVQFEADAMLPTDAGRLPTGERAPSDMAAPWSVGTTLPPAPIDHCFTQWRGSASISDARGMILVRGFGTPCLHVYAPADGDALCLEPVSHAPDALNRSPAEMLLLPPGTAAAIAMRIETAG